LGATRSPPLMDIKEFNEKVLRTETDSTVTFDVRPFGARQGEAIDSYLYAVGMALQMDVFPHTQPIVVLCDIDTAFPSTTDTWLAEVQSRGVAIEIQRVK
jgi:hypothetical protein